jgi:hypothetical protein
MRLSSSCIYAIKHTRTLADDFEAGAGRLLSGKRWVSGDRLLTQARAAGEVVPLVLAAADSDAQGLLYWAVIDDIDLGVDSTACSYSTMRRIDGRPLSALRVQSTRKPLPDSFRRSYAICETPSFLL